MCQKYGAGTLLRSDILFQNRPGTPVLRFIMNIKHLAMCSIACAFLCAPIMATENTMTVHRDLQYGDAPGAAHRLDLYLPQNTATKTHPLILWIHGGAWESGDKASCPITQATRHGFAIASINYRLSREAPFPAQIHDCKGAIRWLKTHAEQYKLNRDQFALWGESAGGHLAALAGTSAASDTLEGNVGGNLNTSSNVQAVIDWFGPTDLRQLWNDIKGTGRYNPRDNPLTRLFGGTVDEKTKLVDSANPIAYINDKTPPFFIVHGDQDDVVPLSQSQMFFAALQKAGVKSELIIIPGARHGGGEFLNDRMQEKYLAFLRASLKMEK